MLAAVVPMLLQTVGHLPVGQTFEAGRLVAEHHVSDASPTTMHVVLALETLIAILTPMAFTYRTARQLRRTRKRLPIHMWHLRQLTPA